MGIFAKLKKALAGKNTLYYPGCLTKYVLKQEAENYKAILTYLGVDFIMLPNEFCCGSPVLNAGYEQEFLKLARKNLELFNEHNIGRIITNCPSCYNNFLKYKEILPDWDIEVEHIIPLMLREIKGMSFSEKNEIVTYHDPCHLGRYSGIYEEPREIIRILGYKLIEMAHNRENSLCCGGGGGLRTNNIELAKSIARKRINEARDIGASKIITPCPLCYAHLENEEIKSVELSSLLVDELGLQVEKVDDLGVEGGNPSSNKAGSTKVENNKTSSNKAGSTKVEYNLENNKTSSIN
jgi:Fe-S oxidoreductase